MRRRTYLGVIGVLATAGCIGDLSGQQDSDGDGVPNDHETTTTTTPTTKTTTSGPPDPKAEIEVRNREPMGEGYNVVTRFQVGRADRIDFVARLDDETTTITTVEEPIDSMVERRIAGDDASKPPVASGALVLAGAYKDDELIGVIAEVRCVGEVNES